MHIGLDGLPLTLPKTGVGHYTFELARALAQAAPENTFELVYPSSHAPVEVDASAASALPRNLKLNCAKVGPLGRHWWSNGLPRYVRRNKIELFHGTNYDVPLWRRCATVLTIHDLSLLLYPETHQRRSVSRARRRTPLMARTADAIITPTKSVRTEVCEILDVDAAKVFSVPEAARASFRPVDFDSTREVRFKLGCGDEFLLAVGTIEPRKNLNVLVTAFEQFTRARPESKLKLVIAGGRGWLTDPFFENIQKSAARDRIVITDYLHDAELRALYSSCLAFVYPSLYEGFGLPPLEAMACGAPVIASRIPALVEIAGEAASFFEPTDAMSLFETISPLLEDSDTRKKLSLAGQARAAEFSWQKAAHKTLEVYEFASQQFSARR